MKKGQNQSPNEITKNIISFQRRQTKRERERKYEENENKRNNNHEYSKKMMTMLKMKRRDVILFDWPLKELF
jgi:hypothetical protein